MLDKAFNAYFEMIEKGFAPNVIICSKIVSSLYRLCRIDEASLLLQKMVDFNIVSHERCFNKFLKDDVRHLNILKIANSFEESAKKISLPNKIVNNIAIFGLCKSGKVDDARRLLSELLFRGFGPDNFTYCTLIHGCSATGNVNEAFNLRDEMLKQGIVPNITTYNALINCLCESGNMDRALRLFYKLHRKGLTPNVVTYNILIDQYCKIGNTREALKLKDRMEEEGIALSIITYVALINGFCKLGNMEESTKLLDQMIKAGVHTDMKKFSKFHNMSQMRCPFSGIVSPEPKILDDCLNAEGILDNYYMSEAVS